MRAHLDLFSGVGGFALGASAAGFTTIALVECDPFAQAVLGTHWPDTPLVEDVRSVAIDPGGRCECCDEYWCELHGVHLWECECLTEIQWQDSFPHDLELVTAGWPCQDLSPLGNREGLAGARSGLWSEVVRILGALRPRLVLLENVPNVLAGNRGEWFGTVLGDLAGLGYDAEWRVLNHQQFGIRQNRSRVYIMAHDSRRERCLAHKRALLPTKIEPAPFERAQPFPDGGRTPLRSTDRVDIGPRISAASNAVAPQIVYHLLQGLKP